MRLLNSVSRSVVFGLALLWLTMAAYAPQSSAQATFSYPPFPANAVAGLQHNGTATIVSAEGSNFLQLTPSATGSDGSAWYTNPGTTGTTAPLGLAGGFTTTFQLQFTHPGGIGAADGIVFLVQNGTLGNTSGSGVVAVQNGPGGQLGYAGLTNSVAVQFDIFCNSEYGDTCNTQMGNMFSSADQISIQSCGASANTVVHGACTFGSIDLTTLAAPIYLADGNVHTATIAYTPPTTTGGNCPPNSKAGTAGCGTLAVTLDQQNVLSAPFNLAYLGLDAAGDAYPGFTAATGGGSEEQDIPSWSFQASVVQAINTTTPPNLPAVFNNTAGTTIVTDIDYRTAKSGITSPIANPLLITSNNTLSQTATWPQYVAGGPFAPSFCSIKAGNNGVDLCSLYVNACFSAGQNPDTADDINCPTVNEPGDTNYVLLKDTFDWGGSGKITPAPGTTISLINFTPSTPGELWQASDTSPNPVCTNVNGNTNNPPTPIACDISDSMVDIYGDQTTTRGSRPKSKGWLITVYNVPMLFTTVKLLPNANNAACHLQSAVTINNPPAPVWTNGACLLDFVVNPAVLPQGLSPNGFVAAPPLSLRYGTDVPAVQPGPFPEDDFFVTNPSPVCSGMPCLAVLWDVYGNSGPTLTSIFGGDGTFPLFWTSKDTVGISEKNIQLVSGTSTCNTPDGVVQGSPCYVTTYFTVPVNIDSVNPTVATFAFNPPGGVYSVGQSVTANFTCADDRSGVASCTAVIDNSGAPFNTGGAINTSTPGNHTVTVTAVDNAGNFSSQVYNYQILPGADVAIFEQETSDRVKPGATLIYKTWQLDLSRTDAAEVTFNANIQLPATVQLGTLQAKVALVSCTLAGCTEPTTGANCSVAATSVSCNIGTLPSIWKLTGAFVKIWVPVLSTSVPGSTFKITATVSSPNDSNPKNNTTSDLITVSK
jgi:hypothetical protein